MTRAHETHKIRRNWDENYKQYEICVNCHLCKCHDPFNEFAHPCAGTVKRSNGPINANTPKPSDGGGDTSRQDANNISGL